MVIMLARTKKIENGGIDQDLPLSRTPWIVMILKSA